MTEDEMSGWHHWLDGRESEWTPGAGDGQGGLACCDSWGHKESDKTEWLNWTEHPRNGLCSHKEHDRKNRATGKSFSSVHFVEPTAKGIFTWTQHDPHAPLQRREGKPPHTEHCPCPAPAGWTLTVFSLHATGVPKAWMKASNSIVLLKTLILTSLNGLFVLDERTLQWWGLQNPTGSEKWFSPQVTELGHTFSSASHRRTLTTTAGISSDRAVGN